VAEPIPHAWIDSSQAPLYVWRFPPDAAYDDLVACCAARETWSATTAEPVAWVVDLTHLKAATAKHRQAFAAHLERFRAFDERWTVASAIVAEAAWVRGLVTAVFWVSPPRFPHRVFGDVISARAWARGELQRHRR